MSLVKKQADRPSRKAVTLQLEEKVLEQAKKYQEYMNYSSLADLVNDILKAAMRIDSEFTKQHGSTLDIAIGMVRAASR